QFNRQHSVELRADRIDLVRSIFRDDPGVDDVVAALEADGLPEGAVTKDPVVIRATVAAAQVHGNAFTGDLLLRAVLLRGRPSFGLPSHDQSNRECTQAG